jgi:hypothetical protein
MLATFNKSTMTGTSFNGVTFFVDKTVNRDEPDNSRTEYLVHAKGQPPIQCDTLDEALLKAEKL